MPRAPDPDEIVLDSEEKCIETQSLDNTSKNEIDLDGNMDVEKDIFSQKISNL